MSKGRGGDRISSGCRHCSCFQRGVAEGRLGGSEGASVPVGTRCRLTFRWDGQLRGSLFGVGAPPRRRVWWTTLAGLNRIEVARAITWVGSVSIATVVACSASTPLVGGNESMPVQIESTTLSVASFHAGTDCEMEATTLLVVFQFIDEKPGGKFGMDAKTFPVDSHPWGNMADSDCEEEATTSLTVLQDMDGKAGSEVEVNATAFSIVLQLRGDAVGSFLSAAMAEHSTAMENNILGVVSPENCGKEKPRRVLRSTAAAEVSDDYQVVKQRTCLSWCLHVEGAQTTRWFVSQWKEEARQQVFTRTANGATAVLARKWALARQGWTFRKSLTIWNTRVGEKMQLQTGTAAVS
eukprot:TRINITY_DN34979_c0_g1_i1.p1 TRINITY_DN34979_c0_g1~~TRINITY_DN34979_c0_g1_i1.p1  ORF type:complete len:352 (+),score=49.54 TRINITY_DN34979_c0_g1_i1:215-1270(+)